MEGPLSAGSLPEQYRSLETFKATNPQLAGNPVVMQNQQLQMAIFQSSKSSYEDLLGMLFSSEIQTRKVKEDEDDDPTDQQIQSRVPNNILKCPEFIMEGGKTIPCPTRVDALPYTIDLKKTIDTVCPTHKVDLVWASWNPPLSEIGWKSVLRTITSTMSESISNSTFPQEFDVLQYGIGYAEGVLGSIYGNADDWVNNRKVFMDEDFCFLLENTIMTNIQAAIYRSKTNLIEKMIKQWAVSEDISSIYGRGGGTQPRGGTGIVSKFKQFFGV